MFGFRSANLLKVPLVTTAAMLAICLLALGQTAKADDSLPQNGKIAFTSDRIPEVDPITIYTTEPDGSNLSQLANGSYPHWSPDGTEMALWRVEKGVAVISIMSADGSNLRDLPTKELSGSYPTWSPDGTKLAFSGGSGDIYTMDLDGSNQINITNSYAYGEEFPDFSPDGSQMCYFRQGGTTKHTAGIYVSDADGSNPIPVYEDNSPVEPGAGCDWSPDGTKIIFHAQPFSLKGVERGDLKGNGFQKVTAKLDEEVYVVDADGGSRTALTGNSASDVEPDWSPDGTKIAFASNRDGDFEIYTMDADGSDVTQVTTNSGVDDKDPDWQSLPRPTKVKPEKQQEERQPNQAPKNRSVTVHPPDTGGLSLLLVASALLFSGGIMFYAGVKRRT